MASVSLNKLDIICSAAAWEHFGVFPRNLRQRQGIYSSLTWICRRGASVHFSCDEGYELQGSKSISCLRVTDSYVGWSDDRPICRGNDCLTVARPRAACRWYLHAKVWPMLVLVFQLDCHFVNLLPIHVFPSHYLPFCCDWPDFDIWLAFLSFLLFSYASMVLAVTQIWPFHDSWNIASPSVVYLMFLLYSFNASVA